MPQGIVDRVSWLMADGLLTIIIQLLMCIFVRSRFQISIAVTYRVNVSVSVFLGYLGMQLRALLNYNAIGSCICMYKV